jgi:hypothetical protein
LKDIGVDGRIKVGWIFKKCNMGFEMESNDSLQKPIKGSCENCNELLFP